MAFTRAWQSSNVPSMATACTFGSVAVVIMRRCTSEMRPFGERATASHPLAAAEGFHRCAARVAGGRAQATTTCSLRAASTRSMRRASSCIATSLNASVGPWNSSSIQTFRSSLNERRHRRMAEARIGVAADLATVPRAEWCRRQKLQHLEPPPARRGVCAIRAIACGVPVAASFLRHVEAAVARQAGEQGVFEAELRGFASGADVAQGTADFRSSEGLEDGSP